MESSSTLDGGPPVPARLFSHGNLCGYIDYMHDWSLTCRKAIDSVVDHDFHTPWRPLTPDSPRCIAERGRWRLWEVLSDYARPWNELGWNDIVHEFGRGNPAKNYIKDLLACYEGEVAIASSAWEYVAEPLPRNALLWHKQYATSATQRLALGSLRVVGGEIHPEENLGKLGPTTILYPALGYGDEVVGHWRRHGRAITLAQLLVDFGGHIRALEIMFWYFHADKLVRKREHPWGNPDVRAAAKVRKEVWGHYGHRR